MNPPICRGCGKSDVLFRLGDTWYCWTCYREIDDFVFHPNLDTEHNSVGGRTCGLCSKPATVTVGGNPFCAWCAGGVAQRKVEGESVPPGPMDKFDLLMHTYAEESRRLDGPPCVICGGHPAESVGGYLLCPTHHNRLRIFRWLNRPSIQSEKVPDRVDRLDALLAVWTAESMLEGATT